MDQGQEETLDAFRARLSGAAISTYVVATLAVPAKIWCRFKIARWASLAWDDVLCVVTLLWANSFFWITMIGLRPSLGKHAGTEATLPEVEHFLKNLYAGALVYCCAIAFIKFTILSFYWKLFSVTARIPIGIIAASTVAWLIAYLSLGAFACNPIRSQWDLSITDAKCLPSKTVYLSGSLINVIVDFILVAMPLPYVWRLRAPIGQRLILAGMFCLGFFVCIVSVIRLTEVMAIPTGDTDATYNLKDFIIWSTVEINIGLLCSCLPSMRRLLSVMGLDRLFTRGSSAEKAGTDEPTPGHVAARNTQPSSGGRSMGGSTHRLKSGGRGLWTSMGLTKIDSDEDAYEMIDHGSTGKSESQAEIGAGGRPSSRETERSLKGTRGIVIQRDWSVKVDEAGKPAVFDASSR